MDNDEIFGMVESHGTWSMSDFQSRYFVVNSQVTNYRRVRQALLEIDTRIASKKQIERNLKKCDVEKRILERDLSNELDELRKELIMIDIDQLEYDISVYEKRLRVVGEELEMFANIIKDIVPDMNTLETYKEHDEDQERNYWIARMAKQAAMDLVTIGRIGQGNMDSIAMMPIDVQEETVKAALKYNTILQNGISNLEKQALKELGSSQNAIDYIDKIVDNQLKIESQVKGEDI